MKTKIKKFEYKILLGEDGPDLNKEGNRGWELVTVVGYVGISSYPVYRFYLKREKK